VLFVSWRIVSTPWCQQQQKLNEKMTSGVWHTVEELKTGFALVKLKNNNCRKLLLLKFEKKKKNSLDLVRRMI